jgi:hypothetical protein
MSLARNIELYHDRTEVDMALSGKAGTAKVRSSAGKKSAQTIIECGFPTSACTAGVIPYQYDFYRHRRKELSGEL